MKTILNKINLPKKILEQIENRLISFSKIHNKNSLAWFNELCFCILTANSKALIALKIEKEMGENGFSQKSKNEITLILQKNNHRFYNKRAEYIIEARKYINIKEHLRDLSSTDARKFLVKNIKGLGYKEASHFLRNVGYTDVAIIDRHILRFLYNEKLISKIPKTITQIFYLNCEQILSAFDIPQNKLDLILWAHMTGKVLK
ncbi:MAG: N-glycosylase/DNA lyase [bacterium]